MGSLDMEMMQNASGMANETMRKMRIWMMMKMERNNVGALTRLQKLMLSHNDIARIPVELGQCQDLELLCLANNRPYAVNDTILLREQSARFKSKFSSCDATLSWCYHRK